MFCKNCGKELADGARFCAECGNVVEVEAPVVEAPVAEAPVAEAPVAEANIVSKIQSAIPAAVVEHPIVDKVASIIPTKKKLPPVAVLGIIAAAILVVCIILCSIGGAIINAVAGPEAVAKNYVIAQETYDWEKIINGRPDFMLEEAYDEFDVDTKKELVEELEELYEDYIDEDDIEEVKIISAEKVSNKDKYDDYLDDLNDEYDKNFKEYEVIKIKYKQDGERNTVKVFCLKDGLKWYAIGMVD